MKIRTPGSALLRYVLHLANGGALFAPGASGRPARSYSVYAAVTDWACRKSGRVSDMANSNKIIIAVGILTVALGLIPVLAAMGILPRGNAPADPVPSWMIWLIGAMFVSAGSIAIMRGAFNSAYDASGEMPANAPLFLRAAHDLLAVGIVCSLALVFSWVAFGPGTRHFSVTAAAGAFAVTSRSGDTMGRVAFGFGSILMWCIAAAIVAATLRKWRKT